MRPESPHQKPHVTRAHLGDLDADAGRLADLLDGHVELAEAHLDGQPLPGGGKVVGVGITAHTIDGRGTGRPALHVLVDDAKALQGDLPAQNGRGVPIVYEVAGKIAPCADSRSRYRPAGAGVSIAPVGAMYSGTLGCVVAMGGQQHILSCNHVLADTNRAMIGTAILQPSAQDGGSPADSIARLSAFVPLVFGSGAMNTVNAAMAVASPGVVDPRVQWTGGATQALIAPVLPPVLMMKVQKSGRTTGVTQGQVQTVGMTVAVVFPNGQVARFRNQFTVQQPSGPFAQGGDSGALVITAPGNRPVGMVMAAAMGPRPMAFASPVNDVLDALAAHAGRPVTMVYN